MREIVIKESPEHTRKEANGLPVPVVINRVRILMERIRYAEEQLGVYRAVLRQKGGFEKSISLYI